MRNKTPTRNECTAIVKDAHHIHHEPFLLPKLIFSSEKYESDLGVRLICFHEGALFHYRSWNHVAPRVLNVLKINVRLANAMRELLS